MKKILEAPFTFALIWIIAAFKISAGFILGFWLWWYNYWLGWDIQLWTYVFGGINVIYSLAVAILFTWLFFIERTPPPNGKGKETIFLKAA